MIRAARLRQVRTHAPLMDRLEPRHLLANFTTTITDTDGDVFQVEAINFAEAPLANIAGAGAGLALNIAGSTATSDIRITRVSQAPGEDGRLNLQAINITGDIDELFIDDFVNIRFGGGPSESRLNISGRARLITIDGELWSPLAIGSNSLANRTTLNIDTVNGVAFVSRGPGGLGLPITSAGIFEAVSIGAAQFVNLTARRFGTVAIESTFGLPVRGDPDPVGLNFTVNATDFNAPFGVKTLSIRCPVTNGRLQSNSPVQSVTYDGVSEGITRGIFVLTGTFDLAVVGRVSSFRTTEGSMRGDMRASSFGVVQSAAALTGNFASADATRGGNATASMDSVRAGLIFDTTFSVVGGIGQFTASQLGTVDVNAGWIGTALINGRVDNSTITLQATTAQRARALDQFTVSGELDDNTILSVPQNNAGTINLNGGIDGSGTFPRVLVGVTSVAEAFSGNPFGTNTFTLSRLNIRQPVGLNATSWSGGIIAAPNIGAIFSNALINSSNGGQLFGIVYRTTTSINFRLPDGSIFSSTSASNSSFGDFRIDNIA